MMILYIYKIQQVIIVPIISECFLKVTQQEQYCLMFDSEKNNSMAENNKKQKVRKIYYLILGTS